MRRSHRIGLALSSVLLMTAALAAEAPPAGPRVYVGFDTETTRVVSKDADGPTKHGGTGAVPLLVGEKGVSWVSFGTPAQPENWCAAGIGAGPASHGPKAKEELLKSAATLWWAEYTLVSASPEKIVLALDWERWTVQADGGRTKVAGDHRKIELPDEEAHTLDFANANVSGPGPICARNVIVRIIAGTMKESGAAGR